MQPITELSYVRDAARPQHLGRALADLRAGIVHWRLAVALAWLDTRNRYRGSVFGPFWITLSTAVMIGGLGLLYSTLFKMTLSDYLPFLAVSLLLWNTISTIVMEACASFTGAEAIIRQMRLPYTVHILRCVTRNVISAAHTLPLIIVVFYAFGAWPGLEAFWALLGLVLLCINSLAGAILLGMLCARFRDVPPIVTNVMQLLFFLSPILWKPELLGDKQVWLPLNPFFVLMETVRGPLLEGGAALMIWVAALTYTLILVGLTFAFFVRFRSRIAFWV
jgi:lipopolysaccharide transport system permease protein